MGTEHTDLCVSTAYAMRTVGLFHLGVCVCESRKLPGLSLERRQVTHVLEVEIAESTGPRVNTPLMRRSSCAHHPRTPSIAQHTPLAVRPSPPIAPAEESRAGVACASQELYLDVTTPPMATNPYPSLTDKLLHRGFLLEVFPGLVCLLVSVDAPSAVIERCVGAYLSVR